MPTANQLVKFEIAGGRIIGVGNGDQRSLFNGYAQVIVRASRTPGDIRLTARAEGIASADVSIIAQ